jgi:hypothetical protein
MQSKHEGEEQYQRFQHIQIAASWTDVLLLVRLLLLLVAVLLAKPLVELLSGLAYSLADLEIDVLLASLLAPRLEDLLADKIVVVDLNADGRDLRDELGLVVADKTLNATEEGLLVLLRSDKLLEHRSTTLDLLDDLVTEKGLGDDGQSAVLGLDAELLSLEVKLDAVNLVDTTLLLSSVDDPLAENIVLARLGVLFTLDNESALEVFRKILGTGLDGGLRGIDVPLDLLSLLDVLGTLLDLLGELVITAGLDLQLAVLLVLSTVSRATAVNLLAPGLGLLASAAFGLLGGLVLLALLGLVLHNESGELKARVDLRDLTASLAVECDVTVLDVDLRLRVLALLAENELGDEAIEVVLKLVGVVGAVDNPAVIVGACVGLSTKLETEVLDDVRRRTGQRVRHTGQVDDDGLDAVALAFDLGLEALHLVAVEGVGDIAANVNGSHGCGGVVDVFEIVTGGRTSGSDSDLLYVYGLLETCNSSVQCTEFVLCDSWSSKHNVNRWWSGGDCAVPAYSENGAVWGEVRLGRREVGANTYTAVLVVDCGEEGLLLRCLQASVAVQRSRGRAT